MQNACGAPWAREPNREIGDLKGRVLLLDDSPYDGGELSNRIGGVVGLEVKPRSLGPDHRGSELSVVRDSMKSDGAVKVSGYAILALLLGRHVEAADVDGQDHRHQCGVGAAVDIGDETDRRLLQIIGEEPRQFL